MGRRRASGAREIKASTRPIRLRGTAFAVAALVVLAAPSAAQAARYVSPSGSDAAGVPNDCADPANPCAHVQYAVNRAAAGETIVVAAGAYSEGVVLGAGKSLRGEDGAAIDGGADPAVRVPPGETAAISGLTLGSSRVAAELRGAATVSGNRFVGGAGNRVGLELADGGASTKVAGNAFSDLSAAIVVEGSRPEIRASTITGTHSANGAPGIGIMVGDDASPSVRSTVIRDPGAGPAVGIYVSENLSTVQGTGADVEQSSVIGLDPGILVEDATGGVMLASDLIAAGPREGLVVRDTAPTATGEGDTTARNLTVWGASGAAAISLQDANLQLDSSIVGPGGIASAGGSCQISYSRGPVAGSAGCARFATTAAPGFVDPAAGDFHLRPGSPMIDTGNPASPAIGAQDFDGDGRALDGNGDCAARRDIGADEVAREGACASAPGATTAAAYRTRVLRREGRDFTFKLLGSRGGNYSLCVRSPHRINHKRVLCRGFRLRRTEPGHYAGTVRWGTNFRFMGPGHYRVSWYRPATHKLLGPRKTFDTDVCPPKPQLMDGVWKPHPRLRIINPCRTITGTVRTKPHLSKHDGDLPFRFTKAGIVEFLSRDRGHLRKGRGGIGPRNPRVGEHIRMTGVFVCDGFYGPMGHTEMHPVFKITYVGKGRTYISGPQYGGTPRVGLRPHGFHPCP